MLRQWIYWLRFPARYHFWGSFLIVLSVIFLIGDQIQNRVSFANGELYHEVSDRWGTPIEQPVPSLRYVTSGAVFYGLNALPFSSQRIAIDNKMNFRKRGLIYFSGFDFTFTGDYHAVNPEPHAIDSVFVFPLSLAKNKLMLSDLEFHVNGEKVDLESSMDQDKLLWTGKLRAQETVAFRIRFTGRGMDQILYLLDPKLPVRDFQLRLTVDGGMNFDYPDGVVPASDVQTDGNKLVLRWQFGSLESGVPVGIMMPSEQAYDKLISTMLHRSWVPFILLFAGISMLALLRQRPLQFYESYLTAASFALYFVLLAYLSAFFNFYLAFALTNAVMVGVLWTYLWHVLGKQYGGALLALLLTFWVVPCVAVLLQGYTGLIYTFGILATLTALMLLTNRQDVQRMLAATNDLKEFR